MNETQADLTTLGKIEVKLDLILEQLKEQLKNQAEMKEEIDNHMSSFRKKLKKLKKTKPVGGADFMANLAPVVSQIVQARQGQSDNSNLAGLPDPQPQPQPKQRRQGLFTQLTSMISREVATEKIAFFLVEQARNPLSIAQFQRFDELRMLFSDPELAISTFLDRFDIENADYRISLERDLVEAFQNATTSG